ncbi:MAG: TRAP transporter substrate-binding protein DctP [Deltaproteobacteria bacterium]|nr:TRAP transporter substrate-binding protein DctP [Deltaproteobacteria bacterium]
MNRKKWNIGLLALALVFLPAVAAWSASADKTILLKLSQPTPAAGFYGEGYAYFAKAVEEETKGQVKVQVYPSASLISDPEAFDAVQAGNVDIAHFMVASVSPTVKAITPMEIPGAYPGEKYKELDTATSPLLEKVFAKYGVKYLCPGYPETAAFGTGKKLAPVKSPADLKGKAVRASGKWLGEAMKMWGGSAVTIPLGDLAVALQRGTVDVVYTSWIVIDSFKLYESAPNITFTGLQNVLTGMIMSEKAWKRLNPEQQQGVLRAKKRYMDFINGSYKNLRTQFEEKIKKSGGTVTVLTAAQNAEFKKVRQPLFEQVKGVAGPDGAELMKALDTMK